MFLREYTTFSSCLDSLSELNIKTKDDFQTKILSLMYNLSGILSNHYYYYKHYDILLNSLSKYLNYVKPESVQFFTEVYLWGDETEIFEDDKCKFAISYEYEVKKLVENDPTVYRFEDDINKALKQNEDKLTLI